MVTSEVKLYAKSAERLLVRLEQNPPFAEEFPKRLHCGHFLLRIAAMAIVAVALSPRPSRPSRAAVHPATGFSFYRG